MMFVLFFDAVLWIRVLFLPDPDPTFSEIPDPDPGSGSGSRITGSGSLAEKREGTQFFFCFRVFRKTMMWIAGIE